MLARWRNVIGIMAKRPMTKRSARAPVRKAPSKRTAPARSRFYTGENRVSYVPDVEIAHRGKTTVRTLTAPIGSRTAVARSSDSGLDRFREFLRTGMPGEHAYVVLLGLSTFDLPPLIESVRQGFPYATVDRLLENADLTSEQMADLTDIPRRTLTRRKQDGQLTPDESDRVLRAARMVGKALELFEGDRDAARNWLTSPQVGLGGAVPLIFANTELGAREVEHLADRLEHGVFA
jgi:putative toxin-antitoxin system antitoxin component (TIGR02293 family)